jgi:uncharacterized membrane protein
MQKSNEFKFSIADTIPIMIWAGITFVTWTFMHGAERFLKLTPEALGKYFDYKWFLIVHITGGGGALVFGIIQFWKKLGKYSWRLHRMVGILYLICILISSVCAVVLAFSTAYEINLAYAFSFQVWVSVWISSTAVAYYFVIKKKYVLHQEWMTRSYLVTLAFVITGLITRTQFFHQLGSFEDTGPSLFWLGWSVPLYLYEVVKSSRQTRISLKS